MTSRVLRTAALFVVSLCLASLALSQDLRPVEELAAELDPLLTKKERKELRKARTDAEKHAAIDRVWETISGEPRGGAQRKSWERRARRAREVFGSMSDDRFEVWMLAGEPEARSANLCAGELWPVEIWRYAPNGSGGRDVIVFFDARQAGNFRAWSGHSPDQLSRRALRRGTSDATASQPSNPREQALGSSRSRDTRLVSSDPISILVQQLQDRCDQGAEIGAYLLEAASERSRRSMEQRLKSPRP
ncbi:MAG: GWxTD domain-containing protein [Acidobacteriota bacterium]